MNITFANEIKKCLTINSLKLAENLGIDLSDEDVKSEWDNLIKQAYERALPKATIRKLQISISNDDEVLLNNERMHSRILTNKLKNAQVAFAYIATCGKELDEWSNGIVDPLLAYYADAIKIDIVSFAAQFLRNYIKKEEQGFTGVISPGSTKDWPVDQQKQLFNAIEDVEGKIGVVLTASSLMIPTKSVSGVFFITSEEHEDCEFCDIEDCPTRRVPFNHSNAE